MKFLEIYIKYNLTEKEIHTLQIMRDCDISQSWSEASFDSHKWHMLLRDGILIKESYNSIGIINCKVADFVHE